MAYQTCLKNLGRDVEIYNDIMVVGALQDREGKIGSAFIYRRNPDTGRWDFEQKLEPPNDEGKIFNFGQVTAIQGNRIAIGDRSYNRERNTPGPKGAVWLYEYDPLTKNWTQPFGEVMTSQLCDNWFGVMLAFTYDAGLVVGCSQDDNKLGSLLYYEPSDKGYEYIFKQKIVASTRIKNDSFGGLDRVSVYGNVLVVSVGKGNNGRVHVFLRKDDVWVEETIIDSEGENFGNRVRVSGNNIIVSSLYNAYFYALAEDGGDSPLAGCMISIDEGAIYDNACTTCSPFVAVDKDGAMISKDKERV